MLLPNTSRVASSMVCRLVHMTFTANTSRRAAGSVFVETFVMRPCAARNGSYGSQFR